MERQFKVSMVLKVCFEATDDSQCILSLDVLKDTLLPKSICDWVAGFSTLSKYQCSYTRNMKKHLKYHVLAFQKSHMTKFCIHSQVIFFRLTRNRI